jgi:hypothetical protein
MPKPFLKILIFLSLINAIPIAIADDCAKIAQLTGGVCIVPPIVDQTDPDWEKMFTNAVLNALISSIQPSIITVSPTQLPQGGTANLTLTASKTHFNDSSHIDIGGFIIIDITQVTSDTKISFNITAPINATPDYYDITVNTGSEIATGIGVLRITPASNSPEILSISPAIVSKNSTIEMQIFGNDKTNFTDSSIVKFASKQADNSFIEDTGITAQITTVTPNLLTITANVTATANIGLHNITVTTGSEEAIDNNELGSLRINERDSDFAEITSITPNYASQGDTVIILIAGSSVEFINNQSNIKFGATGIEILSTTVTSPTQATAEIKIADNALLGTRDVYIETGAEIATKLAGFAIFSPASISLNTNQGQQGNNVQLMITGDRTNFEPNVSQINFGGDGITVASITVIDQTTIIANIQIASDAEPITRDISVVTGEEVVAFLNAFTVTALPEEPEIPLTVPEVVVDEPETLPDVVIGEPNIPPSIPEPESPKVTPSIIELTDVTGNANLGLSETEITIFDDDTVAKLPIDKEEPNFPPQTPVIDEQTSPTILPTENPESLTSIGTNSSIKGTYPEESTIDNSIPKKNIPIETEENLPISPKFTSTSFYAPACPNDSSEINVTCMFPDNTIIENIIIAKGVSVSNGILTGIMENHGWASINIAENGILIGGIVTGYIQNEGTMANFEFRGASIIGGTLGGIITNNSPIIGIFEDVYLEANTHITGGELRGDIIGSPDGKAILEQVVITGNGILKNVIIGEEVDIADTVMIDESVEFIYENNS